MKKLGLVNEAMNIESHIIEDNIISFFPCTPRRNTYLVLRFLNFLSLERVVNRGFELSEW